MIFHNRQHAGQLLAQKLLHYKSDKNLLVLGLPRGGIPVAFEIAKALETSLDALLVRKLGVPGEEELAMGAITLNGIKVLNQEILQSLEINEEKLQKIIDREVKILKERNRLYRNNRPIPDVKNLTVILVDDGIATGATIKAAIKLLKTQKPKAIIVATPVISQATYEDIKSQVGVLICLEVPQVFYGVGEWYQDFHQTSDKEVIDLLKSSPQKLC